MIRQVNENELRRCHDIITKSFRTVAVELGLTRDNCPTHTSFMPFDKLQKQFEEGRLMLCSEENGALAGYCSLRDNGDGTCELENLAVLPEYRHLGIGRALVAAAECEAIRLGCNRIKIGIIEDNTRLKDWYADIGFLHTGTRKFDHLPFTVGFMEKKI